MNDKIARLPSVFALASGLLLVGDALACNDNAYLGMACLTTATYCPQRTIPADGASHGNQMLQALTGKATVPDLRAQAPAGTRYCIVVVGPYPQRP